MVKLSWCKLVCVYIYIGLYAPYWRSNARGLMVGLTAHHTKNDMIKVIITVVCVVAAAQLVGLEIVTHKALGPVGLGSSMVRGTSETDKNLSTVVSVPYRAIRIRCTSHTHTHACLLLVLIATVYHIPYISLTCWLHEGCFGFNCL